MPRKARIDAAGALHHIIVRGIERWKIFCDDVDRDSFVKQLWQVLNETHTDCFARVLIPNHSHLLLRTALTPISGVMRRLLTGYVVQFNRRQGHLFQNRYKSILCQEDPYLMEWVRYIHLNPLRAKLVVDYKSLKGFSYPNMVEARSVLCYWAAREYGISTEAVSKRLDISQPTASQSVKRGEKIVKEKELKLMGLSP